MNKYRIHLAANKKGDEYRGQLFETHSDGTYLEFDLEDIDTLVSMLEDFKKLYERYRNELNDLNATIDKVEVKIEQTQEGLRLLKDDRNLRNSKRHDIINKVAL